jgi:hypothetical protein
VICNSAVTVAINIEVPFGAAFMLTDNSPGVALLRDLCQGIVRIWRLLALEPSADAMGRGSDGRCRIFVLLGCAVPLNFAESLDAVKKGVIVSPIVFPAWQQQQHASALRGLTQSVAEAHTRHGSNGHRVERETKRETAEIMAWNTVERKSNESQHFAYFLHLCALPTRGWRIRCITDFAEEDATHPPVPRQETEEEEEEGGEDDDDEFDVDAADSAILHFGTQEDAVYSWFVSSFVTFFHNKHVFWEVTSAFFGAQGEYRTFVNRLTKKPPSNTGNGCMVRALKGIFKAMYSIQRIVALPTPVPQGTPKKKSPYMVMKGDEVVLRRRANFRLFNAEELRKRPVHAQLGVQASDLVILQMLQSIAYAFRLELADLLGFSPGCGGFTLSGEDTPEVPLEMGCVATQLDFTPRSPASPGMQPADMRCGGLWGFAGDVDERFKDDNADMRVQGAWKILRSVALSLKVSTHNMKPLRLLGQVLKETVGIQLEMKGSRGTTVGGKTTKNKLESLCLVQRAEGFSQRIEFKIDGGGEEWSAAFKINADTARSSAPADNGPLVVDTDQSWQQSGSSADKALLAARTIVAEHCDRRQEWLHTLPLDVPRVESVIKALRECEAGHAGVQNYGHGLQHALETAYANRLGSFVPITTLREPDSCGPRRYSNNPLDAPPMALAVMLDDHKYDRLCVYDANVKGALLLRLLQKHVHLQRQLLSGISSAEPDAPPSPDQLRAATEQLNMLEDLVRGGDMTSDTLNKLIVAREAKQAVLTATAARQGHGPSTRAGGSIAIDDVLPSTAKLEALLRNDDVGDGTESGLDCTELSRAVVTGKLSMHATLLREHEAVREETYAVIDALITKGGGWHAELRAKLNNRKKAELRSLRGDEKWAKEQQLQSWARKVLLERLLDDMLLLVEAHLAKLNGGAQYVQFVDTRDCTKVRFYVPRDPDLGLPRNETCFCSHDRSASVGTIQLVSIGMSVEICVDNDDMNGELKEMTGWESADEWVENMHTTASTHPALPTGGGDGGDQAVNTGLRVAWRGVLIPNTYGLYNPLGEETESDEEPVGQGRRRQRRHVAAESDEAAEDEGSSYHQDVVPDKSEDETAEDETAEDEYEDVVPEDTCDSD